MHPNKKNKPNSYHTNMIRYYFNNNDGPTIMFCRIIQYTYIVLKKKSHTNVKYIFFPYTYIYTHIFCYYFKNLYLFFSVLVPFVFFKISYNMIFLLFFVLFFCDNVNNFRFSWTILCCRFLSIYTYIVLTIFVKYSYDTSESINLIMLTFQIFSYVLRTIFKIILYSI